MISVQQGMKVSKEDVCHQLLAVCDRLLLHPLPLLPVTENEALFDEGIVGKIGTKWR
jgi:hypothetical protein